MFLRFGTFELDLSAGELRKRGVRIRLQEQPLQVLTALLRHPGRLVTREELRCEVWSADTFVDFDNGLNTAVNKLREAFGDSSSSPQFIETLPRRGYRFIAPVTSDGQSALAPGVLAVSRTQRWKILMPLSFLLIAGLLAGGLVWRSRLARHVTEKENVILGDFANLTGDGVFDGRFGKASRFSYSSLPF